MKPTRIALIATDWPELERYCPNWNGMQIGLKRLEIPFKFISCRPTLNIEEVVKFKPDLIIYCLLDMVKHAEWRAEIRRRLPDAAIVMWYGDYRDEKTTQIDANCSELDAMFVSNDNQAGYYSWKWNMKKVFFLPLGCEPLAEPRLDPKFSFPFVFIGGQIAEGAFHERASFIERFKIEGDLTIINSFEAPMRARIFKSMPAIYSSSKVCLDVSHFTDRIRYTSIRFWEIPAFWGFALTKRWPGCEEFYPSTIRTYFDTFEEAIEKKNYYLKHEAERQDMVAKAHKEAYNNTYDRRFLRMFSLL